MATGVDLIDEDLYLIADHVRGEMERFARRHKRIGWDAVDLDCLCAISSHFLTIVAAKFGYKLNLIEGSAFEPWYQTGDEANHCWNEYNGAIIDLTAKQFQSDLAPIHVTLIGGAEFDTPDYIPIRRNSTARRSFRKTWPKDQSPFSYTKEIRAAIKRVTDILSIMIPKTA